MSAVAVTMAVVCTLLIPRVSAQSSIVVRDKYCPPVTLGGTTYTAYYFDGTTCVYPSAVGNREPQSVLAGKVSIPTFIDLSTIENFSVVSYVSLAATLVMIGLVFLWVFLIVKAGVNVINSQGDPAALEEAKKRIFGVFASVAILVIFFVVLNVVAVFAGVGNFTQWPKYFSQCNSSKTKYYGYSADYYFQIRLQVSSDSEADALCF